MIKEGAVLQVADNSGADAVRCIRVLKKKFAKIGDKIVVSVIKVSGGGKIKKGSKYTAIVVRTKFASGRSDGSYIRFGDNAVVLIKKEDGQPIGTRIFGPIPGEEVRAICSKIVSIASEVI